MEGYGFNVSSGPMGQGNDDKKQAIAQIAEKTQQQQGMQDGGVVEFAVHQQTNNQQ